MAIIALCAALSAGTATSRAVLGPALYSHRTLIWTMGLALLLAPWLSQVCLRRARGTGVLGGASRGALAGIAAGGGLGLFAALHLAGENRDLMEALLPVPVAWIAVMGSCLTGLVWGALLGLLLGGFALGVARAILDFEESALDKEGRR